MLDDGAHLLLLHQALPIAFDRTLMAYRAFETLLGDGRVHHTRQLRHPSSGGETEMTRTTRVDPIDIDDIPRRPTWQEP